MTFDDTDFGYYDDTDSLTIPTEDDLLREKRRLTVEAELNQEYSKSDRLAVDMPKNWATEAACTAAVAEGVDPDIWFAASSSEESAEATDICFNECPIRLECLKASTISKEAYGIWGGLPASIRRGIVDHSRWRAGVHNFDELSEIPNPYDVQDRTSPYSRHRLTRHMYQDEDALIREGREQERARRAKRQANGGL